MSWNHRILATEEFHLNGESEIVFSIHEVYYDKEGIPNGYTANPVKLSSDTLKGMKWTLKRIEECMKKPILRGDDRFPQEYKP